MTEYDTGNRQSAFFGEHAYLSPLVNAFPIQGCLATMVKIFSISVIPESVIPDTTKSNLYILSSTNVSAIN